MTFRMPKYDTINFDPPAPIATVELQSLTNESILSGVFMPMDTGADVTLLPGSVLEAFPTADIDKEEYEMEGFDGNRTRARALKLRLRFLNKRFTGRFLIQ
jgi:hypothetical protein